MAKAQGVSKRVVYKKETGGWGVIAGPTGGQVLRRVTADFNLNKETYESSEIRTDFMTADMRHGVRSADGSLSAELSPGSYADFIGSVVARDFSNGVSATGLSLTIAAAGTNFTLTRSAGSWLTDGFKVGNVVRITAGTGGGTNTLNNNLLILSMTALVITVKCLAALPIDTGSVTAATVAVTGKQTYVPKTGHTDQSYTVEQWYSDIAQSEVFTGLKVGTWSASLPATGLVTTDFSFMGKNLEQTGTSAYFTAPTAASTTGIFAAVNGAILVNGTQTACITSMDFSVERAQEAAQCLGSNFASEVFTGRINVTGNLSAYFSDGSLRDIYDLENKVSIVVALTTGSGKTDDVISIVIPSVKFTSATNADTELGIVQSIGFTSLLNSVTTGGLIDSVIQIQDTSLV